MKNVKVEELSLEAFAPFGTYTNLINPNTEKIGEKPVEFFRDMSQLNLGSQVASFSICRVEQRPFVIDVVEFHNYTSEGILPLDNDVLIHVIPATPAMADLGKTRVFRIPKGTFVTLRPGVWHHAPFTVNNDPANVVIVLPERTYFNDCKVVELTDRDKINIEL